MLNHNRYNHNKCTSPVTNLNARSYVPVAKRNARHFKGNRISICSKTEDVTSTQ